LAEFLAIQASFADYSGYAVCCRSRWHLRAEIGIAWKHDICLAKWLFSLEIVAAGDPFRALARRR
jgi:hypothetical protein